MTPLTMFSTQQQGDDEHASSSSKRRIWRRRVSTMVMAVLITLKSSTLLPQNEDGYTRSTTAACWAMGPNLLHKTLPEMDPTGRELENEMRAKAAGKEFEEAERAFAAESDRIFHTEGSAAHAAYIKRHNKETATKNKRVQKERRKLVHTLLFERGVDPFHSHLGRNILFQFDFGIDLAKEPNTSVAAYVNLRRLHPQRFVEREDLERRLNFAIVQELQKLGKTKDEIVHYFQWGDEDLKRVLDEKLKEFEKNMLDTRPSKNGHRTPKKTRVLLPSK